MEKEYVMIYAVHEGRMGGGWEGPYRSTFLASSDQEAIEVARARERNFGSVWALFPAEAEIQVHPKKRQ